MIDPASSHVTRSYGLLRQIFVRRETEHIVSGVFVKFSRQIAGSQNNVYTVCR